MGLILPYRTNADLGWAVDSGPFHFTSDGIKYFSEGFISIDDPGHLAEVLFGLKEKISTIEDGQIELLLEAQRCVRSGCNRAAMVVMGVACEDSCLSLLDAISLHCTAPASDHLLNNDWKNCCDMTLNFTRRWKPGIRILEAIKKNIRSSAKGKDWWQWWELVPGSLYTVGEAVRIARNAAAHDTNRKFSKAEASLLLSAMPTQLEMIARLTEFLKSPTEGYKHIQVM